MTAQTDVPIIFVPYILYFVPIHTQHVLLTEEQKQSPREIWFTCRRTGIFLHKITYLFGLSCPSQDNFPSKAVSK